LTVNGERRSAITPGARSRSLAYAARTGRRGDRI